MKKILIKIEQKLSDLIAKIKQFYVEYPKLFKVLGVLGSLYSLIQGIRRGKRISQHVHLIRYISAALPALDRAVEQLDRQSEFDERDRFARMRNMGAHNRIEIMKSSLIELLHLLKYLAIFKASTTLAVNAARQQNINKKKGDSMRNYIIDSRGRRIRVIDHRAYAIRHNDGIKDAFLKLKEKCKEVIAFLKSSGWGRRIVKILLSALAIVSAIVTAKNAHDARSSVKRLAATQKELDREIPTLEELAMQEEGDVVGGVTSGDIDKAQKVAKLKMKLKVISGLLGVIVGTAGAIAV